MKRELLRVFWNPEGECILFIFGTWFSLPPSRDLGPYFNGQEKRIYDVHTL